MFRWYADDEMNGLETFYLESSIFISIIVRVQGRNREPENESTLLVFLSWHLCSPGATFGREIEQLPTAYDQFDW